MDICVTAVYTVTVPDKPDFWSSETGQLNEDIAAALGSAFPQKIKLTENAHGRLSRLTHFPLTEGKNAVKCISCGRWLNKPDCGSAVPGLDISIEAYGKLFCQSCAWELTDEEKKILCK